MTADNTGIVILIVGLYTMTYSRSRCIVIGGWISNLGAMLHVCNFPRDTDNWVGGVIILVILGVIQLIAKKRLMTGDDSIK